MKIQEILKKVEWSHIMFRSYGTQLKIVQMFCHPKLLNGATTQFSQFTTIASK